MIHVEGLSKRFGDCVLLENTGWHVKKRDRIGLSGPNGSGKSTLLRMLAGLDEPDSGEIRMATDTSVGYLPQDGLEHRGRSLYDEVSLAFEELLSLQNEQREIEERLSRDEDEEAEHERLLARYAEATERFKQMSRCTYTCGRQDGNPSPRVGKRGDGTRFRRRPRPLMRRGRNRAPSPLFRPPPAQTSPTARAGARAPGSTVRPAAAGSAYRRRDSHRG